MPIGESSGQLAGMGRPRSVHRLHNDLTPCGSEVAAGTTQHHRVEEGQPCASVVKRKWDRFGAKDKGQLPPHIGKWRDRERVDIEIQTSAFEQYIETDDICMMGISVLSDRCIDAGSAVDIGDGLDPAHVDARSNEVPIETVRNFSGVHEDPVRSQHLEGRSDGQVM